MRDSVKNSLSIFKKPNFSQEKRIIKTQSELEILSQAALFGRDAFARFGEFLKRDGLGMDERMAHFEAESIFKYHGQLELSFSPIVALGRKCGKTSCTSFI